MVIYADLVFLINFLGDFLCLWILSELDGKIPLLKRLLASAAGGIYGLLWTLPELLKLPSAIGKISGAVIMILICTIPSRLGSVIRKTIFLFLSSMILSGAAELLESRGMIKTVSVLFGVSCICVSLLSCIRSKIYAKHIPCELSFRGRRERFLAFYDSGNRLFSQDGERMVIVADECVLRRLVAKDCTRDNLTEWVERELIIEIPFSACQNGVMQGIALDYAKVGEQKYDDVILAISQNELKDKVILHSIMA